jgi:hypothetical protein
VYHLDIGQFVGEPVRHPEGVIGTCVVGHRDPRRVRHGGADVFAEAADTVGKATFLVIGGYDDVEHVVRRA